MKFVIIGVQPLYSAIKNVFVRSLDGYLVNQSDKQL
jgi:hypothetical protein